jgi:hypothetical protein
LIFACLACRSACLYADQLALYADLPADQLALYADLPADQLACGCCT